MPASVSLDGTLESSVAPRTLRRPIAVILSRFPLVTETFILREVLELERRGQPVRLVPLLKEEPEVVHPEARPWVDRALYTPFLSLPILRANWKLLRERPRRYLGLLAKVLLGSVETLSVFTRTLVFWPKSVYLASRLDHEGIRHIHAHYATYPALTAFIVSSLTDISFSFTVHAHDIFLGRALLEDKIRAARFVRTISAFNKRYLEEAYPEIPDGKYRVIHTGVEPDRYRPADYRSASDDSGGQETARILCVAALKPYKGVSVLVRAVKQLVTSGVVLECVLVGDGPLRDELGRLIVELGLVSVVRLAGAQTQHQVAELMTNATVFVLPSIVASDGQMEGIPVALMEAMACERAVVASSLSGIPELVEDGVTGYLVEPDRPDALARAVRRLLDDRELRELMGKRGRQKVETEFQLAQCVSVLGMELDDHNALVTEARLNGLRECEAFTFESSEIGLRALHDGKDSRVMELVVAGSPPRNVVHKTLKFAPGDDSPTERARREFARLQMLERRFESCTNESAAHSAAETSGYGVPRPLCLDAEGAAYLMEACAGVSLDVVIRNERARLGSGLRPSLRSALWRAGRWLALMQRETATGLDAAPVSQSVVASAHADLSRCVDRGLPRRMADMVAARLERLQQTLDTNSLEVVGHHGDLWPGNIYVAADSVQVIDFEGFRDGLPLEDVAHFLVHTGLYFCYPGFGKQRQEMTDSFLSGLCSLEGSQRPTEVELEFYRLTKTVQLIAHRVQELGTDLAARWRQRVLAQALRGG